jgi:hypothetical protein
MGGRGYLARVHRVDDHWSMNVYGLNGANVDLFNLDRLEDIARDLIALVLNVPTDSFNIAIEMDGLVFPVGPA